MQPSPRLRLRMATPCSRVFRTTDFVDSPQARRRPLG
jgi:hypothetical protein